MNEKKRYKCSIYSVFYEPQSKEVYINAQLESRPALKKANEVSKLFTGTI
jgi:hypothetical protein